MIDFLLVGVLIVLFVASIIDIKYRKIPSVVLTGLLLVVLMLRLENIAFGLIALVFALLVKDLISDFSGMEFGVADIKILATIGLLVNSFSGLAILFASFGVLQFAYTLIWRWKISSEGEMPFIPLLFAVYIILLIFGAVV